jgi:hypothetical protein
MPKETSGDKKPAKPKPEEVADPNGYGNGYGY